MLDALASVLIAGAIVPQARKAYSKQFGPILSERTLLQKEAGRLVDECFSDPIIVINTDQRFIAADRYKITRNNGVFA